MVIYLKAAVLVIVAVAFAVGTKGERAEPDGAAAPPEARHASAVAPPQKTAAPCVMELFGDQRIPYFGFGDVWIRRDGLVLIETEDRGGIAFFVNTAQLAVVEEDGEVRLKRPVAGQTAIHEFGGARQGNARSCSAAYRHVGDLDLDYDERTGHLVVRVSGGKESFAAEFDFRGSQPPPSPRRAAGEPDIGGSNAFSCECYGPNGGSCSASKTCPEGYECACNCYCDRSGNSCTCSSCHKARRSGVEVVIDPAPGEGPVGE